MQAEKAAQAGLAAAAAAEEAAAAADGQVEAAGGEAAGGESAGRESAGGEASGAGRGQALGAAGEGAAREGAAGAAAAAESPSAAGCAAEFAACSVSTSAVPAHVGTASPATTTAPAEGDRAKIEAAVAAESAALSTLRQCVLSLNRALGLQPVARSTAAWGRGKLGVTLSGLGFVLQMAGAEQACNQRQSWVIRGNLGVVRCY